MSCLNADERVKTAGEIISHIRKSMEQSTANVRECNVSVNVCGHGLRPFGDYGTGAYRDLIISVNGKEWKGLGACDVSVIGKNLSKLAGANGIETEVKELYYGYGSFTPDEVFPCVYRSYGKPCKAFSELQKTVLKKCGMDLEIKDLYRVRLFGKRGQYDEVGKRSYTAYNEEESQKLLDLVKSFGRKQITCELSKNDDIETEYSQYYETECYGSRERTISVAAKCK